VANSPRAFGHVGFFISLAVASDGARHQGGAGWRNPI
jgi:hypothetical protein